MTTKQKPAPTVRFLEEDGEWFVEGLILPFGGPVNGQDLTGTHFAKSTDFCLDWYESGRPGMYAHGFDATLGTSVVGREIKHWKDDKGVWLRAQIDKAHEYAAEIKELVEAGLVSLSSGAVDHLVRVAAKSGEITRWPWVEWSIVPNPANPEAVLYQVKSTDAAAHLREVGEEPVVEITDDATKQSSAADDASEASMVRGCLVQLLAEEIGEGDQEAVLRRAIALIDRFISAETAEIGSEGDAIESDMTDMAAMSVDGSNGWASLEPLTAVLTPQALHDAATASGAKCAGEAAPPEPVLAVRVEPETATAADLAALKPDLVAAAQKAVKERLGI